MVGVTLIGLTLPPFCVCPKSGSTNVWNLHLQNSKWIKQVHMIEFQMYKFTFIGMQILTVYYFSKWVDYARVMAPFLL